MPKVERIEVELVQEKGSWRVLHFQLSSTSQTITSGKETSYRPIFSTEDEHIGRTKFLHCHFFLNSRLKFQIWAYFLDKFISIKIQTIYPPPIHPQPEYACVGHDTQLFRF